MRPIISLLLLSLLFSCGGSKQDVSELPPLPDSLPADFSNFYARFHTDSSYQMAHISWPLRGVPDEQVETEGQFTFTPEIWNMQRIIDPEKTGYVSRFTPVSGDMIVERIINPKERASLERRFLRRGDGEWELIYYQGVRPIN